VAQTLKDVMTPNPVTCPPDATLADVARLMRDRDIGNVIVAEDGRLVGIVTDRDIVVRGLAEGLDGTAPISEVVTTDVVALSPEDAVERAVQIMRQQAVRRVPVVDNGRPVGIVTIGDLAVDQDPESALADISEAAPNND
jgi:CBS domain-containing protein